MSEVISGAVVTASEPWRLGALLIAMLGFLVLVASAPAGCSVSQLEACSPADAAGELKLQECQRRIAVECKGLSDTECPVIQECAAWAERRCEAAP